MSNGNRRSPFRSGDRVRCISPFNTVLVAGTYTIEYTGGGYVYLKEIGGGWDENRFVLVESGAFVLGEIDA